MEIYGYKFEELSELDQQKVRETAQLLEELYKACHQRKPMMRAGAMPCDVSPDEPGKVRSDELCAMERSESLGVSDCKAAQLRSRLLRSKLRSKNKEDGLPHFLNWKENVTFRDPPKISTQLGTEAEGNVDAIIAPCTITRGKYQEFRPLALAANRKIQILTPMVPRNPGTADESPKNALVRQYWQRALIAYLTTNTTALRRNIEVIKCLTGETAWDSGMRKLLTESLNRPMPFHPENWDAFKQLTLSYPAVVSIPNLSNCVELKKCAKSGSSVFSFVTTKRLKPGDVVLTEEACLWKIAPEGQLELCDYCGADAVLALVPCVDCNRVFYCSEACHKAGVSEYHWLECKVLRNQCLSLSATQLLALRIFAVGYTVYRKDFNALYQHFLCMTKKQFNPSRVYNARDRSTKARYDALFAIPLPATIKKSYENDPKFTERVNQLNDCLVEAMHSSSKTGKSCNRAELSKLLKHYVIILTRSMLSTHVNRQAPLHSDNVTADGSDALERWVCGSYGFYPLMSLFGTSCNPNMALVSTASNRLVVVAIRPVRQDERLTIMRYSIFCDANRVQRQEAIQEHLKMACECDACVYDYDQIQPSPDVTLSSENDLKHIAGKLRSFGAIVPPYSSEFLWVQTLFQEMLKHCYTMRMPNMIGYLDRACWKDIDILSELSETTEKQDG